ncbi:MAG TPA: NUDIX domain-containing protein [Chitinophagales bacterium]|nr:NUDIX domain-containing protein [Chitinophagales bacterium]
MKKHTKVVVSAVVWHKGKILLLKRAQNFKELNIGKELWDLPGGKLEFGLSTLEALQNELTEETRYVKINRTLKLIDAISYLIKDEKMITNRINIIYDLKIDGEIQIELSNEHSEFIFTDDRHLIQSLDMMSPIQNLLLTLLE